MMPFDLRSAFSLTINGNKLSMGNNAKTIELPINTSIDDAYQCMTDINLGRFVCKKGANHITLTLDPNIYKTATGNAWDQLTDMKMDYFKINIVK